MCEMNEWNQQSVSIYERTRIKPFLENEKKIAFLRWKEETTMTMMLVAKPKQTLKFSFSFHWILAKWSWYWHKVTPPIGCFFAGESIDIDNNINETHRSERTKKKNKIMAINKQQHDRKHEFNKKEEFEKIIKLLRYFEFYMYKIYTYVIRLNHICSKFHMNFERLLLFTYSKTKRNRMNEKNFYFFYFLFFLCCIKMSRAFITLLLCSCLLMCFKLFLVIVLCQLPYESRKKNRKYERSSKIIAEISLNNSLFNSNFKTIYTCLLCPFIVYVCFVLFCFTFFPLSIFHAQHVEF